MFERSLRVVIWVTLGILIGRAWETVNRQKQVQSYHRVLLHTRAMSSLCYGVIADHWSREHLRMPGSKEISGGARYLSQSYAEELK